jgi:ATP-dependent DNA helicase RecG
LKKYGNAHRYFEKIEKFLSEDPKGLHEFAQTKMQLATKLYSEHLLHIPQKREAYNRLLHEAMGQLGRVVQLTDADARRAWAYRDLARVKRWLGFPRKEIESDYRRAINLLPEERTFRQELERFNINKKAGR